MTQLEVPVDNRISEQNLAVDEGLSDLVLIVHQSYHIAQTALLLKAAGYQEELSVERILSETFVHVDVGEVTVKQVNDGDGLVGMGTAQLDQETPIFLKHLPSQVYLHQDLLVVEVFLFYYVEFANIILQTLWLFY